MATVHRGVADGGVKFRIPATVNRKLDIDVKLSIAEFGNDVLGKRG
jgi:hypothetical protein